MAQNAAKKSLVLLGCGVLISLFSGCFWSSDDASKDQKLYLVNVLDKEFFDDCHIPGSLNVSMMDLKKVAQGWSKNADVVIYCSNYACQASGHCCKILQKMGFESVWDYDEGMAGWYQAHLKNPEQYPVVGPCKEAYLTMDNKPLADEDDNDDFKVISTVELKALIDGHKDS